MFHALANLPSDLHGIAKCLNSRKGIRASRIVPPPIQQTEPAALEAHAEVEEESSDGDTKSDIGECSMEGSTPAQPAEPGTLKVSLLDTPAIGQMTERESAHPNAAAAANSTENDPFAEFASVDETETMHAAETPRSVSPVSEVFFLFLYIPMIYF